MYLSSPTVGLSDRASLGRALLRTLLVTVVFIAFLLLQLLVMPGPPRAAAIGAAIGMPLVFGPIITLLPWWIARRANRETEAWTQAILAEVRADRDHGPVAR
jgi:predicted MFS family arabinose efflux permease